MRDVQAEDVWRDVGSVTFGISRRRRDPKDSEIEANVRRSLHPDKLLPPGNGDPVDKLRAGDRRRRRGHFEHQQLVALRVDPWFGTATSVS